MSFAKYAVVFCCIGILETSAVRSQTVTDSPRSFAAQQDTIHYPNYASIFFDKNLNTYRWIGTANYRKDIGSTLVGINEQFISSLIQSNQKLIRDEQTLGLLLKQRFSGNVRGVFRDSSFSLSDNKSVLIGNTSYHMFYGGVEYKPIEYLTIEPLIGMRFDNQLGQNDKGPSYRFDLYSDPFEYSGYQTKLNGMYQYDKLSPRILETRNAAIGIEKVFFEKTRNAFHVQYYHIRRDFYSPADIAVRQQFNVTNNIETRIDQAYSISDSLDYSAGQNTLLSFQGRVFTRSIERGTRYRIFSPGVRPLLNTTIDELKIDGGMTLRYAQSSSFDMMLSFNYQERDEKHRIQPEDAVSQNEMDNQTRQEEFKNNHAKQTAISSIIGVRLSRNHSLRLMGSASLLRYDTPSAANDDDRDELWYLMNLSTDHRLGRNLTMHVEASVHLAHLVYIRSTRSANNTWNRIFRLSPRLEYIASGVFESANTFEVLANYTVYDVEFQLSSTRSYVFRQFAFIDSSLIHLTHKLTLDWYNNIRLYERGELRWEVFRERPTNYFVDKTYIGKVRYEMNSRLIFSVGIRYFSQLRFRYIGTQRDLESALKSIGPVADIAWNVGNKTELLINGWYENQTQTNVADRSFANVSLSLTVRI